jgi:hypothetical protein
MKTKTKWTIPVILICAVCAGGYFAGRALDHFLANGSFTRLIGRKTAAKLEADTG